MRTLLPLLLLFFSIFTHANVAVEDFAFKADITPSAEGLHRLELPVALLIQLTRSDLGDINVFDADGHLLPSLVQKVPLRANQQQTDLSIFQFNQYSKQASKVVTTQIQNKAVNRTSKVETTETLSSLKSNQIYIIEIPPTLTDTSIEHITLDTAHSPSDQLLELRVEVGTTLDTWHTLYAKKTISPATLGTATTNKIEQIPNRVKYIRLSPHNTLTEFTVTRATAQTSELPPANYVWHSLDTSLETIDGEKYHRINVQHHIHNTHLRIFPVNTEGVVQGTLYGSDGEFSEKQLVRSNIQQHNYSSDELSANEPLSINMTRFTNWWFAPLQDLKAALTFEIGIPHHEIKFLGNQRPPFTLAWGRADHQPIHTLHELISTRQSKASAVEVAVSGMTIAGGEEKLRTSTQPIRSTWLLWAALVLAVVITGAMALSLLRDLKKTDNSDSPTEK